MSTHVCIERVSTGGRAFVHATLCSPNGINVLSSHTVATLREALRGVARGEGHGLIIAAEGRCFSAGADVKEFRDFTPSDFRQSMRNIADLFLEMMACPRPVISVVQADAIGGGAALAFCSDYLMAAGTASFSLPEVQRGLAGLGYLLPRLIGRHRATELTLLGRRFDAARLREWGLVNEVCDAAELDARRAALCAEFAALTPSALQVAKRSLSCGLHLPLREAIEAHIDAQVDAFGRLGQPG